MSSAMPFLQPNDFGGIDTTDDLLEKAMLTISRKDDAILRLQTLVNSLQAEILQLQNELDEVK